MQMFLYPVLCSEDQLETRGPCYPESSSVMCKDAEPETVFCKMHDGADHQCMLSLLLARCFLLHHTLCFTMFLCSG